MTNVNAAKNVKIVTGLTSRLLRRKMGLHDFCDFEFSDKCDIRESGLCTKYMSALRGKALHKRKRDLEQVYMNQSFLHFYLRHSQSIFYNLLRLINPQK